MIEVVAARGYAETRVVDVIAAAGVSRKTFYEPPPTPIVPQRSGSAPASPVTTRRTESAVEPLLSAYSRVYRVRGGGIG
jgi:hypothetical protein